MFKDHIITSTIKTFQAYLQWRLAGVIKKHWHAKIILPSFSSSEAGAVFTLQLQIKMCNLANCGTK